MQEIDRLYILRHLVLEVSYYEEPQLRVATVRLKHVEDDLEDI